MNLTARLRAVAATIDNTELATLLREAVNTIIDLEIQIESRESTINHWSAQVAELNKSFDSVKWSPNRRTSHIDNQWSAKIAEFGKSIEGATAKWAKLGNTLNRIPVQLCYGQIPTLAYDYVERQSSWSIIYASKPLDKDKFTFFIKQNQNGNVIVNDEKTVTINGKQIQLDEPIAYTSVPFACEPVLKLEFQKDGYDEWLADMLRS